MYQFTSEEIETMTEAQTKALKYIKESEFPIHVEDKFAREFLALRILSLFREGERNPCLYRKPNSGHIGDEVHRG